MHRKETAMLDEGRSSGKSEYLQILEECRTWEINHEKYVSTASAVQARMGRKDESG
jgi:hypothetical protein